MTLSVCVCEHVCARVCACVCACVHACMCVHACSKKFVLTVFHPLLCNGLCAPIWRNSTQESKLLLYITIIIMRAQASLYVDMYICIYTSMCMLLLTQIGNAAWWHERRSWCGRVWWGVRSWCTLWRWVHSTGWCTIPCWWRGLDGGWVRWELLHNLAQRNGANDDLQGHLKVKGWTWGVHIQLKETKCMPLSDISILSFLGVIKEGNASTFHKNVY